MKLLFVIDNLSTGGAQRQMVNLGVGLHQLGHQIDFFCYAPGTCSQGRFAPPRFRCASSRRSRASRPM